MKILNNSGLDPLLFMAIDKAMNSHPSEGYYLSVTQLLQEPQQVLLNKRHGEKVEREALDLVDLFMGTAIHEYIHQTAVENNYRGLSEDRFTCEILGKVISGGMDNGILSRDGKKLWICDYKVVKSYSAALESKHGDWAAQLNMYAYMVTLKGLYKVERLSIVPIIKDFSQQTRGKKIKDYSTKEVIGTHPSNQIDRIDFPVWEPEKTKQFMEERVQRVIDAEKLDDKNLPRCEDTWKNNVRCSKYCQVRPFCHQAKRNGS